MEGGRDEGRGKKGQKRRVRSEGRDDGGETGKHGSGSKREKDRQRFRAEEAGGKLEEWKDGGEIR